MTWCRMLLKVMSIKKLISFTSRWSSVSPEVWGIFPLAPNEWKESLLPWNNSTFAIWRDLMIKFLFPPLLSVCKWREYDRECRCAALKSRSSCLYFKIKTDHSENCDNDDNLQRTFHKAVKMDNLAEISSKMLLSNEGVTPYLYVTWY